MRIEKAGIVLRVLQTWLPTTDLSAQRATLEHVTSEHAALALLPPGTPERASKTAQSEQLVEAIEAAMLEADSLVSTAWLRRNFRTGALSEVDLADYCALLTIHADGSNERQDKIAFVVTRLSCTTTPEGRTVIRPKSEVEALLRRAVPISRALPQTRDAAAAFFAKALAQLASFTLCEELFATGFLLETKGYKLSLRGQLIDPDILYASAEVNLAISLRLGEFLEKEQLPREALAERLAEIDRRIQEIFRPEELKKPELAKYELSAQPEAKAPVAKVTYEALEETKRPVRLILQIAGALIVAVGVVVLVAHEPGGVRLEKLDAASLARHSPVLEWGAVVEEAGKRRFVGRVSAERWKPLSRDARRKAANDLAAQLKLGDGVELGSVFRGEGAELLVQIVGGRVVWVD